MNPKDTKNDQAGSSKEVPVNDPPEYLNTEDIDSKVQRFLEEVDNFKQGLVLADNEINDAIELLKRDPNVLNKTPYYKEFLKKYGSIYGSELYMCGPVVECYKGYKVQSMVAKNNTFSDFCIDYRIIEEQLKCYWLIGEYKNKFYYIDSSDDGKGYIYSMDLYSGITKLFSKNFLGFLDKIFSTYQKDESDESENVDSN